MALEYNGHRIGAMQYNGVTIGEAMMDGVVVYRSVITVTPVAPTFHDGEPWITLPTVEGVTYSVSGTPGYDASVTVTATAQPGYELVGTASWSHTYGPPPRYSASGSGDYGSVNTTSWRTLTTHTVSSPGGLASGTWAVERNASFGEMGLRVQVDGVTVATFGPSRINTYGRSLAIPERQYVAGQSVAFQVTVHSGSIQVTWSWSLS